MLTTSTADECFICRGRRFYPDDQGQWHNCPRCNPPYIPAPEPVQIPMPYPAPRNPWDNPWDKPNITWRSYHDNMMH